MFDVFYCVILNAIVYRFVNGVQLNLVENAHQSAWTEAFSSCNDPTYWHQIFNDCQPESCNASSVADSIIRKSTLGRRQQYWIYGYVLRSPVIVNIGCYSLSSSAKKEFHRGMFSSEHNSAFECSRACPDASVNYIFLRNTECLCIPEKKFYSMQSSYLEENINTCTIRCPGNSRDICGGVSTVQRGIYSAYEIVNRKAKPGLQLGDTCVSAYWDNVIQKHQFDYRRCSTSMMYICRRYNKTSKSYANDGCNSETVSWFDARQLCYDRNSRLTKTIGSSCPFNRYWAGLHVVEKITWGKITLPSDALCLMLVIDGSGIRIETEKCDSNLYSLCYVSQHTSSQQENSEATIKPSTIAAGRTTLRGPVDAESDSDEDKPDFIPIIAGSVGGLVALVIVVIIVFIIQRRKKSNNKHVNTAVDRGEPDTYSEPIKNTVPEENRKLVIENTIPEESRKLVNVTEEGIYNHLGDSEKLIEMKPQDSSIYDITGDDEYHVFTCNERKQKSEDDDDLYDHGAASDVYNTLNDTVTTNRPESDTYNVINAK